MSEGLSTSSQFPLAGFPDSATTKPESTATSDSTTTTTTTAAAGRDATALDSSRYAGHHPIASSESHTAGGLAKPAHTMHSEDVEVEGRPPYIHVGFLLCFVVDYGGALSMTLRMR
ncbi:uncharacterized protein TrAtP1_000911 [Trichoderma atroviride]|uniref:uncharacterized protein n=1 Tax=Hypocrea atroviridis TaxID=63577 RepID=UPI00332198A2|nr:hypothetical protein TrAtP1_000911 [Trichoderma atroviride]